MARVIVHVVPRCFVTIILPSCNSRSQWIQLSREIKKECASCGELHGESASLTGLLRANGLEADHRSCCSESPDPQLATSQWEPFPTRWFSITSLHVLFATATPFVYFDTLNLNTISGHLFHDLPNTHAGPIKRQVVCRLYQGRRPAWRPPRWNVMAAEVLRRDSCVKTVWEHCICQVVVSQTKEASVGRLRLPCRTRLPSDFTIAFDFLLHPSLH